MKWHLHYRWFEKQFNRGRRVDALEHIHLTLTPLLFILNIRYRPTRWDFGFRYLKEELPEEVVRIVERLCYVPDAALLEERFSEAERLLIATVKELEHSGIVPIDRLGFDILPGFSNDAE